MIAETLTAPKGHGRGLPNPQSLLHLSALIKDDLPAAFLEISKAYICLSPAAMINSSSSSHARLQGAARWKQGWNDAWKGWDDSSTTTSPISESIPEGRVTNALHLMQDHLQQTTVIAQERSQKTHTEQAASKTQGNAAHEVMEAATQGCLPAPSSSKPEERKFVVDSRAFVAHAEQESGTGDCSSIQKPDNGYHGQWKSANKQRSNSVRLRFGFIRDSTHP